MTDYQNFQSHYERLLQMPVFGINQQEKWAKLSPIFEWLHQHHRAHCAAYANITSSAPAHFSSLENVPFLAVKLFKLMSLSSTPTQNVFRTLHSSGTTGQTPATITLDKETSARQSKTLVKVLQESLGRQRLPMLIIDSPVTVKPGSSFTARAAGIQGLSFFGRDHTYALDEQMQPNWQVIEAFHDKYHDQPVLLFGFTFMVWQYFVKAFQQSSGKPAFERGILLHSGGWKKLESEKVDNDTFKNTVAELFGIHQVINFYGMAEQVGSIFTECEAGHLHCPLFSDIIVRDPYTMKPCGSNQQGLLQCVSVLPTSYPGHSILTEDLGRLLGEDDCRCGRKGRYFAIDGRLPQTEVRGCSDTFMAGDAV
ncbi:acyl-protein synthetase [Aestuariibacter salexigens]|uniref:LuxE/PaaK family acyltransferase n=1 Tax=Aestuariibacter salexigens TaxID=226010 RepID=UPI00041BBEB0|nr:acyl-protein synthetase [Aestuariibacter salexigens]